VVGTGFSFEVVDADDYDALRPGYAPKSVAWVMERGDLDEGSLVVDLAAGTGQLSKGFAPLGVKLVAVEPARNMRSLIEGRLPAVVVLDGSAEAIPLGDGVADAVVVGNAFHHFDADGAFAEIRRVLRPGGVLALFWALPNDVETGPYPALLEVDQVLESARDGTRIAAAYRSWTRPPIQVQGFTPFERRAFPTTHIVPSARLADLYATSSDVASLPSDVRTDLLGRIRRITQRLPDVLQIPARSVVDLCFRPRLAGALGRSRRAPRDVVQGRPAQLKCRP
jgi:SAM-dependent methyltransferase